MQLLFNPPRNTNREEWKKIWRWKRLTEKAMNDDLEERIFNTMMYGNSHPEIYEYAPAKPTPIQ